MSKTIDFEATKALLHDSDFYYIICIDNNGIYSYVNNRFAKSFEYVNSNFVGQPYHIAMHPDDTKITEEVGGKCYENPGMLFPATLRKTNGRGGYIVTQWEFILMEENGEPQGVFCLGHDITEFIEVKAEIVDINRDLRKKNAMLDVIAYEQSHLIRAPLANIMGLVNILKSMEHSVNAYSVIKMLEDASSQLDGVIKSIVTRTTL